jgi:hypothetical protein
MGTQLRKAESSNSGKNLPAHGVESVIRRERVSQIVHEGAAAAHPTRISERFVNVVSGELYSHASIQTDVCLGLQAILVLRFMAEGKTMLARCQYFFLHMGMFGTTSPQGAGEK